MSPEWSVTVSAEAEQAIRDLHPRDQRRLARQLDVLAREGPGRIGVPDRVGCWRVSAGRQAMLVAPAGDRALLLVRLEAVTGVDWVGALPLSQRSRLALARALGGLGTDTRATWRSLRRSPVFTGVVILTLALGAGGATATMGITHAVHRGALPFEGADRLYRIRNLSETSGGDVRSYNVSSRDVHLLREQTRNFDGIAAQHGYSLSLVGDGEAERVAATGVSPGWARIMGLRPMLGRVFTPEEEALGRDAGVALISASLWTRRFGGDRALDRLALRYDGGILRIVGVMPPRFAYPYDADVWTPWTFDADEWRSSGLNVVGRLKAGLTAQAARDDVERVHAAIRTDLRGTTSATGMEVATLRADLIRDGAGTVNALTVAVLCLLLLTCANVASLLAARFVTRRGEIGLRAALGARAGRQMRPLVIEALTLFATGGAVGLLLAGWLQRLLGVLMPESLRTEVMVGHGLATGVAAVSLLGFLAAGLVVGVVAAVRASRVDLASLVKEGSHRASRRDDRRMFDVLVIGQLGLSLVLLVGAGALIEHFRRLSTADPGYDLAGVETFRLTLEQERYATADARLRLVQALEEGLGAEPDVAAVGITTVNPLCCGNWGAPVEVEGRPIPPDGVPPLVHHSYVSPGFFGVMRLALRRGEGFGPADQRGTPPTVVVDEALARSFWPDQDPIGKRIRVAREGQPWRTVVGVAPVVTKEGEFTAQWYLPYHQDPLGASTAQLHLMVRARGAGAAASVRRAVHRIDPGLALHGVTTMTALAQERLAPDRIGAVVSGLFAAFGMVLAGFSLYGLLSYSIASRAAELGIRMALGASRRNIVSLVLHQAGVRLVVGLLAGCVLALGMNQVLRGLVAGVEWVRPATLGGLLCVLAAVAGLASLFPVRRALALDPARVLNGD